MRKKKVVIEFKYEGGQWVKFDETLVPAWADEQERRARLEHPLAVVRVRPVEKSKK
jgi:hypothetical protein